MIENISQPQPPIVQPIPNPPKIWLPFTIALILVALVSGGGVYLWQQNQLLQLKNNPTTTVPATANPTNPVEKQITLAGINLTIPGKWQVESNDNNSARILTDYPAYKVELLVRLENASLTESGYKSSFDNTITKYGEVFKTSLGGAFDSTGIKINGKLYLFIWEIVSNEPTPSNLDGIWTPKHNVTDSDIWNITLSAKPLSQTVSQDTRIELSADGWYKKFLTELDKGDNCNNFYATRFSAKPNTFVTYTSTEFKYSIDLPYNLSWGDKENKVKPFDRDSYDKKSIMFGQPSFTEGCSFFQASLTELPRSTINQAIQLIDAENVKQNKENTSFPETASYKKITNLKYPVLEIDTASAMFGSVKSAKIFLPTVTLELSNSSSDLVTQLVNSIVLLK